jgi:hypothetical protein
MLLRVLQRASGNWNGMTHLHHTSGGKHGPSPFFHETRNGDDAHRPRDARHDDAIRGRHDAAFRGCHDGAIRGRHDGALRARRDGALRGRHDGAHDGAIRGRRDGAIGGRHDGRSWRGTRGGMRDRQACRLGGMRAPSPMSGIFLLPTSRRDLGLCRTFCSSNPLRTWGTHHILQPYTSRGIL